MSVREEDRQNKNCPSRGLGLAAAAIGVGVGAALYYFFSKRPENPHEEGSTSSWECEQAQAFTEHEFEDQMNCDDSYTTLSEHTTTDTSIHTSPLCNNGTNMHNGDEDNETQSDESLMSAMGNSSSVSDSDNDSISSLLHNIRSNIYNSDQDNETQSDESLMSVTMDNASSVITDNDSSSSESEEESILDNSSDESEESNNDWEITSSTDVPTAELENSYLSNILLRFQVFSVPRNSGNRRGRLSEEEQIKFLRDQAFRERSWSLEECSICFDVILKNQEVMSLPCTHHFHTACILPWLQEQQTCPNCRKAAE